MNAWLLAKDLESIAAASEDEDVRTLCRLVRESYDYPVDSVVISPELELLGHRNVHDPAIAEAAGYLAFLREALGEAPASPPSDDGHGHEHGEEGPSDARGTLVLTPQRPAASILDVFHVVPGDIGVTLFPLDLSAFPEGGTLEIDVRVGTAGGRGTFELLSVDAAGGFAVAVAQASGIAPGASGRIEHRFGGTGGALLLGARADPEDLEGGTNAFLAELVVRAP